jgi:hypothetical protein
LWLGVVVGVVLVVQLGVLLGVVALEGLELVHHFQ